MFEKEYKLRPRTVRAVQYDGSREMADDLVCEFFNLERIGSVLYFTLYDEEPISEDDWLLIENVNHITEIIDKDNFYLMYEEVRDESRIII